MILYDKAHWIFEADEMPDWPPMPDGKPVELVNITDMPEVQEGWLYDRETGEFSPPPPEPVDEPATVPTVPDPEPELPVDDPDEEEPAN